MIGPAEPAGLYVHVPFCSAVCPYCDFAVRTGRPAARAAFVDALIAEVALWSDWPEPIDTVYLGGGTPSLLEREQLARVLEAVRQHLPVLGDARIFMEVNPEDVNRESTRAWRSLGVGTVSIGVQSFDDAELRFLGRRHDAGRARDAVASCLETGFATVSIDLIFGVPGQPAATLRRNLDTAVELQPDHVSCYQLTVHEGTAFGRRRERGRLDEMPEDEQAGHFALVHRCLEDAGWSAYEVSNFARAPEHRSRHNLKYWRHAPYLGLGPSAHSFDGTERWWNERELDAYQDCVRVGRRPIAARERLSRADLALETVMLGLRTTAGIELSEFERRFDFDLLAGNEPLIDDCVAHRQLKITQGRLAPTAAGLAVADGLAARFRLEW